MVIKVAPFLTSIALVGGLVLVALVMSNYQRETTSIEDKYQYRSADEIDATYNDPLTNISNSAYYNDNVTPHSTGVIGLFLSDDQDHDGLSNNAEKIQYGTDPQNPDTDGDGTSDGIEIMLGTDPLNKDSGGIALPPYPTPPNPPTLEVKQLLINLFYKNVKNITKGDTKWTHQTDATIGDRLSFLIYMELTNTSTDQTLPAQLTDQLGQEFNYIEQSSYISFNDKQPSALMPDDWITKGYTFAISPDINPQKPVPVEITFDATLVTAPASPAHSANNQAKLQTSVAEDDDIATVNLK